MTNGATGTENGALADVATMITERKKIARMLEARGWQFAGRAWFIKNTPRLGWIPESGTFIIGYYEFPRPIDTVEKMESILKLLEI